MAVYTCIRTVRLIFINELPRNLYWITFSILIIYSTMFMVYLNNLGLSYIQTIIGEVTAFLGEISCSMALLYWVVIDKQTLPRLTLTWFRIIILSDMMVSNATFVLNMCFLNSNEQQDTNIAIGLDWSYILPQFSIVGFIVFSGFALRFGYHAYKMRLYTEMQRFTLLVALTAILCAFSATKFFMYCFWHLQYGLETINEMAVIEVTKHTVFTVRALACSMALGLHWPNKKEQSKRNSTLSGKTVVESDSASSKIEERKSSAGHYSILEKPPKAHTSTTVPGVQVSDSSLNGIDTENR
ncbi:hypothetical protein BDF19DRAFT_444814 [Syncephalis fuscata]|nr:hypothetical protein BDF19DRAFT_444814 [Syncephalis fuscata]